MGPFQPPHLSPCRRGGSPHRQRPEKYQAAAHFDPLRDTGPVLRRRAVRRGGSAGGSAARLANYKRVRKVILREEEFPKTATREIKRYEVAGLARGAGKRAE